MGVFARNLGRRSRSMYPYFNCGTAIELAVLGVAYQNYHSSAPGYELAVVRHYEHYKATGELPFFAKRRLGIL